MTDRNPYAGTTDPNDASAAMRPPPLDRHGRPRRRRQKAPPSSAATWLTRIAIGLSVVVVGAIAAVAVLVAVLSPAKLLEEQLVAHVKETTGRDLVISGGSGLSFWPAMGIALNEIRLSAPAGMTAPETVRARSLNIRVSIWPLLTGNVEVDRIALVEPVIDLRVDRNGRASWQFGSLAPPNRSTRYAQAGTTATDAGRTVSSGSSASSDDLIAALERLKLNGLEIANGTINYRNEGSGEAQTFEDIDLSLRIATIDTPVSFTASFRSPGGPLSLDGELAPPRALLSGQAVPVQVTAKTTGAEAKIDGTIRLAGQPTFDGNVQVAAAVLDSLTRLAGTTLPDAERLGTFEATSDVSIGGDVIQLDKTQAKLGDLQVKGQVTIALASVRPNITADLSTSGVVDVDKLAGVFAGARRLAGNTTGASTKAGNPKSIDDLIRRSVTPDTNGRTPEVRGTTQRHGWSTVPIDTSALGAVDVTARLNLEAVQTAGLTMNQVVARVRVLDSAMRTNIDSMQLYSGSGIGVLTADPVQDGLSVGGTVTLTSVSVQPLLRDVGAFEKISGRGDLKLVLASRGAHEFGLVSNANGNASFVFRDGAIVGWNIAKMMRGISQGQVFNLDQSPTEKTDFSEFSASFDVKSGVAETKDLKLLSPLVRVSGTGKVLAPTRKLDLVLQPALVASLQGQGASGDESKVAVPVTVKGDWDDPSINVDYDSLLQNPDQLKNTVDSLRKKFKGKSVGDVIDGLFGR